MLVEWLAKEAYTMKLGVCYVVWVVTTHIMAIIRVLLPPFRALSDSHLPSS